jgi:hypothetical protein
MKIPSVPQRKGRERVKIFPYRCKLKDCHSMPI